MVSPMEKEEKEKEEAKEKEEEVYVALLLNNIVDIKNYPFL
jgi:hypothetical protein